MENKFNAIIIGATGAVGRELVDYLLKSNKYGKIVVFVRRIIDRWVNLKDEEKKILKIIKIDNLDFLGGTKEEILDKLGNENVQFDVVFNVLGSRVKMGDEEFRKVDFTYVVNSAEMCVKLNIPHFSHCSAMGADKSSWFLYNRVKGEAEEEEMKKNIKYISIFRPGGIVERDNDDRFLEKIMKFIPFLPRISAKDLACAMFNDDLNYQLSEKKEEKKDRFNNEEILKIVEKNKNTGNKK